MAGAIALPIGVSLSSGIEYGPERAKPYKARVRWIDPVTKKRPSKPESFLEEGEARAWIERIERATAHGIDPLTATMSLAEYSEANMPLAMRGLEKKTMDPYLAGWRKRVVPTLGHLPVTMITNGVVDRAVHALIADECSRSVVKNSIAPLVRVMEQARRDGIIDGNPARVSGWQREYKLAEDELEDPRSLALPDWHTLTTLADALVARSFGEYRGWGEVVVFAAGTAARIGEVSGCRVKDIDTSSWTWQIRRQTTPAPGGLVDKGTKGKRARKVPLIEDIRELVERRIALADRDPDARLFQGPRGGRITTAVLRDATRWDEVVSRLGYDHLRRHDLRHTGLTWMADAGVPVHHLQKIAGHGSLMTTQRYLHPEHQSVADAGELLTKHLRSPRSPRLIARYTAVRKRFRLNEGGAFLYVFLTLRRRLLAAATIITPSAVVAIFGLTCERHYSRWNVCACCSYFGDVVDVGRGPPWRTCRHSRSWWREVSCLSVQRSDSLVRA